MNKKIIYAILFIFILNILIYSWVFMLDEGELGDQVLYHQMADDNMIWGMVTDNRVEYDLFRPLLMIFTWVNYHVFDHMYWMTFGNLVIHAFISIFVFLYLLRLNIPYDNSLCCAVFLSLVKYSIPTGVPVVDFSTYMVVLMFAVYLYFGNYGILLSIICLLSKEEGILLPLFCLVKERQYKPYVLILLLYAAIRFLLAPVYYESEHVLAPFYMVMVHSIQLFFPVYYGYGIPIPLTMYKIEIYFILISMLMGYFAFRKNNWQELGVIASSAIVHYPVYRERLFYLPCVFFVIAFAKNCKNRYIIYGVLIHSILYALLGLYERL